jgi:hypothetical protein
MCRFPQNSLVGDIGNVLRGLGSNLRAFLQFMRMFFDVGP